MTDIVRLVRPRDWLKNIFVLMPLPFALGESGTFDPVVLLAGLAAMSLVSSASYVFNDLWDVGRDQAHPDKRRRPIAAGAVSPASARLLIAGLAVAGGGIALAGTPSTAGSVLLGYAGLQLFYTLYGKHLPLVDVFLLSSGFVLRVLLGCALVGAPPSGWLLFCSSSLALFLALAKRRGDLLRGVDDAHRPSLAGYSRVFLDQSLTVAAGLTIMAYALYCLEAPVLVTGREFLTLPFVLFGVLEYLRIVHLREAGASPVDVLLGSRPLLVCGAGWILAALYSVGSPAGP